MPILSATDAITPAFRHAWQQMFKPIRFAFWWRIAVLGLFTGEFAGGGGFSPPSFPAQSGGTHRSNPFPAQLGWFTPTHIIEIAALGAVVVIVLTLIFVYINSILRFVLFDAVLHANPRIGEGWRKWRQQGRQFFTWQLLLALAGWMLVFVCLLLPLFFLFTSHHIGFWFMDAIAVATLVLGFLVMVGLGLALNIAAVLAKDFIVPMMALEGITWQEGWRRFRIISAGHAGEYVIYLLMKFVLRIAAGILHTIAMLIPIFILMIPAVILIIAGVAIGAGSTAVVKALLITVGIIGGVILFLVFLALSALAGAPIAYFFPAYSIYFFAGRYEPLGRIVFPPPPIPPPMMPEPNPPLAPA
ncbi:MAG TPA: hypothetical protein VGL89_04855 [Candidatus Koribacter sp.]